MAVQFAVELTLVRIMVQEYTNLLKWIIQKVTDIHGFRIINLG